MKTSREDELTSDSAWYVLSDDESKEIFSREKHLTMSKTKKMKNYLKKCKSTANNFVQSKIEQNVIVAVAAELAHSNSNQPRRASDQPVPLTSWYVTDEFYMDEEPKNHVTVVQMTDAAQKIVQTTECDGIASMHLASIKLDAKVISQKKEYATAIEHEEEIGSGYGVAEAMSDEEDLLESLDTDLLDDEIGCNSTSVSFFSA